MKLKYVAEGSEDTYTSYWRVNSGYRLPKRLRTKPITCEYLIKAIELGNAQVKVEAIV